jgi:Tol biopolymer transport system component
MLTFIRGESTFSGPGQIYVKLLPDGDPVQLTNDTSDKMSPKFSPDGARIGYSTAFANDAKTMDTWVVPVLGGKPRRLLTNATGLTWFEGAARQPRVLFSELTTDAAWSPDGKWMYFSSGETPNVKRLAVGNIFRSSLPSSLTRKTKSVPFSSASNTTSPGAPK